VVWPGAAGVLSVQTCTSDRRLGPARMEKKELLRYCPFGARCGACLLRNCARITKLRSRLSRRNQARFCSPRTCMSRAIERVFCAKGTAKDASTSERPTPVALGNRKSSAYPATLRSPSSLGRGWRIVISPTIPQDCPSCYHSSMRHLVVLFIHFLATLARLLGPGGVRSIVAELLLLKHQLLLLNRSRQRPPIYTRQTASLLACWRS